MPSTAESKALSQAVRGLLVPWASSYGFKRKTDRLLVKQNGALIYRIIVDANGASGPSRTQFIYAVNPIFDGVNGFTVGDYLSDMERWDMSSEHAAARSMKDVIHALNQEAVPFFLSISTIEEYLDKEREYGKKFANRTEGLLRLYRGEAKSFGKVTAKAMAMIVEENMKMYGAK